MCGRYTLVSNAQHFCEQFSPHEPLVLTPRYNISPQSPIPVIATAERRVVFMNWGLKPHWMKFEFDDFGLVHRTIDTILAKPGFKRLLDKQRCLVPATGFYLWKEVRDEKHPFFFHKGSKLFAFGAIYDKPATAKELFLGSTCLITHEPLIKPPLFFPLIIPEEYYSLWLSPKKINEKNWLELLEASKKIQIKGHPVSKIVNNPTTDEAVCVESLT